MIGGRRMTSWSSVRACGVAERGGPRSWPFASVGVLYVGHLFFFCAGSGLWGDVSWRLDRGRLAIRENPGDRPRPFWVALGSAGIKLSAEWHEFQRGRGGWVLYVPLWIPLGVSLVWFMASWRPRPTAPSGGGS